MVDGHFIYTFYICNAAFTSSLSIILNILLIGLIYKSSTKELKAYCHVLLQNCIFDMFLALSLGLTLIQFEVNGTRIYVHTSFPGYPTTGIFPCLAGWFYVSALFNVIWSMFIQSMFRYCLIVRRYTLSRNKTWLIQLTLLAASLLNSLPYLLLPCSNFDIRDNLPIIAMDLWEHFPNFVYEFRSQSLFHPYFIAFILILTTLTCASIFGFFIFTIKVRAVLNSAKACFSPMTLKIHKQFGKKMILQSISPAIALCAIGAILTCMYALPSEITMKKGGYVMLGLIPMHYIVLFNPLITLLSIQSYRRVFFCSKKFSKFTQSNQKSVVQITSITRL